MSVFKNFSGRRSRNSRRTTPAMRVDPRVAIAQPRTTMPPAHEPDQRTRQTALREAFTPTRPQRSHKRLAGRSAELARIFHAISHERAHVVIHGERGLGKTSLVNLVASAARSGGHMVARFSCTFESDFDEIVRGLARDLPKSLLAVAADNEMILEGCEPALPRGKLSPRDVALLPGRLTGAHLMFIVDEFDRVTEPLTRTRFADTIKQLSDRGASVTVMLVGVSDSLEELLGHHPSIQRNVVGIPMPLLTEAEVEEILEIGSRDAQIDYPPDVRRTIVDIARGVPYIVHLLGLHAGEHALRRSADVVNQHDLLGAIRQSVLEIDPRVAVLYESLTQGERNEDMLRVLHAIATARQDRFGRVAVRQASNATIVADMYVPQDLWQHLIETGVMRACPSAGYGLFTFAEPMLPHYVLLRTAGYGWSPAPQEEPEVGEAEAIVR